eukprot:TRINITY_DN5262_c0_g1_i1.p2 TRINITY_DN5262_c0_g1~~TRINITY_DN5262_c0_g1_i1.p2  ORF type:complete len:452 (+),score=80.39 TRINITY_DN5262_c0_g1_i1:56-1357(+)
MTYSYKTNPLSTLLYLTTTLLLMAAVEGTTPYTMAVLPSTGNIRWLESATMYVDDDHLLVLAGGQFGNFSDQLYSYAFKDQTWKATDFGVQRMSHCSVVVGDHVYLFGGVASGEFTANIITKVVVTSASNISVSSVAKSQFDHDDMILDMSCVFYDNALFIFGGRNSKDKPTNRLASFNFTSLKWTHHNSSTISPRYGHSSVLAYDTTMFTFGGMSESKALNEVWVLQMSNKSWVQVNTTTKPPATYGSTAIISQNDDIAIFGGVVDKKSTNSVWVYSVTFGNWSNITPKDTKTNWPSARKGQSAVYSKNRMLIFGGDQEKDDDLWQLVFNKNCEHLSKCAKCVINYCGWCVNGTKATCYAGDMNGPFVVTDKHCEEKENWLQLGECPRPTTPFFVWIVVVVLVIAIGGIIYAVFAWSRNLFNNERDQYESIN